MKPSSRNGVGWYLSRRALPNRTTSHYADRKPAEILGAVMFQTLSLQQIRSTLVSLSATGLVACGGSTEPAEAPIGVQEVPAAAAEMSPEEASGAEAPESSAATSPSAIPSPPDEPASSAPAEASASVESAEQAPTNSEAPAATPMEPAKPAPTKASAVKSHKKAAGGKGACGAGTCG